MQAKTLSVFTSALLALCFASCRHTTGTNSFEITENALCPHSDAKKKGACSASIPYRALLQKCSVSATTMLGDVNSNRGWAIGLGLASILPAGCATFHASTVAFVPLTSSTIEGLQWNGGEEGSAPTLTSSGAHWSSWAVPILFALPTVTFMTVTAVLVAGAVFNAREAFEENDSRRKRIRRIQLAKNQLLSKIEANGKNKDGTYKRLKLSKSFLNEIESACVYDPRKPPSEADARQLSGQNAFALVGSNGNVLVGDPEATQAMVVDAKDTAAVLGVLATSAKDELTVLEGELADITSTAGATPNQQCQVGLDDAKQQTARLKARVLAHESDLQGMQDQLRSEQSLQILAMLTPASNKEKAFKKLLDEFAQQRGLLKELRVTCLGSSSAPNVAPPPATP